jgi:hypothetical protein
VGRSPRILFLSAWAMHLAACEGAASQPLDAGPPRDIPSIPSDLPAIDVTRPVDIPPGEVATPPVDAIDGIDAVADVATIADDGTDLPRRPGLRLLERGDMPPTRSGSAHLTQIVARDPWIYLANSPAGIAAWRLDGDRLDLRSSTEPTLTDPPMDPPRWAPRCVRMSVEPSGARIFCAAGDNVSGWLALSDPERPAVVDEGSRQRGAPSLGERDVFALDGLVLYAGLRRGVLAARLTPTIAPPIAVGVGSDVVAVHGDGDSLAALDRDRGLLRLQRVGDTVRETGALALPGPPLGLRVRGGEALVSMGSEGLLVATLTGDAPQRRLVVTPPCVVTSADRAGDLLAVGCITGVALYDLSGSAPRLAGWASASYGVLDVAFVRGGTRLLAVDWRELLLYETARDGEVDFPEVSDSAPLRPGQPAQVRLRNLSARTQRVTQAFIPNEAPSSVVEVAAGAVTDLSLSAERITAGYGGGSLAQLSVRSATSSDRAERRGDNVFFYRLNPTPPGPPVPGERFPPMTRQRDGAGPAVIPTSGERTRVLFLQPDCALQWPIMEDVAWRQRMRRDPDRAVILSVELHTTSPSWSRGDFLQILRLGDTGPFLVSDYLPPGATNALEFVSERYGIASLAVAENSDIWEVNPQGMTARYSVRYRGPWAF